MNLGTIVAEDTMKKAADIMHVRGITERTDAQTDALVLALRREAKVAISTILDDGKVLLDSGRAGWLEALTSAECASAAGRAVREVFGE